MKIKITFLLAIVIALLSLNSCAVTLGGHGRAGHPREHQEERHDGDHG